MSASVDDAPAGLPVGPAAHVASPTVWRRWLAAELQRLRAEAGLEQKQVAKALRCTVTKVSYFENAQRPVVPRDLDEVLLPLYKVPEARWPEYMAAAHRAREKGWWEDYDGTLHEWFARFVGLEQGASALSLYEPQYVPGLLQTPAYTEAVIRSAALTEVDEADVARRVGLRVRRQGILTREVAPVELTVVLDEAVLRRVVGGRAAMHAQVEHLLEAAALPNVTLHVLPFDRGAHAGMAGGFTIMSFPWAADPGIGFLESAWSVGVYFEQPHEIEAQRRAFAKLCDLALPPGDSLRVMAAVAADLA